MNNVQEKNHKEPFIDRPPRIQPPLPEQVIEIPPPPDKNGRNQGFIQLFLPLVSILGYSLVSVFGGGRNILFMIPMALSVIVSSSVATYTFLQERKRIRELEQAYADRLRMLRSDMEAAQQEQRLYYEHTHPNIDSIHDIGFGKHESRMGQRLWERRKGDHDFASLRLGMGDIASKVVYSIENTGSIDDDPQISEALQLAEDSQIVRNAPVIIPLRPINTGEGGETSQILGRHSIGISGNASYVMDVTRAFVMQLAAFHVPSDFQIYVLGTPESEERWTWAKWLPHTNTRSQYEGNRMSFERPLDEGEDPKKTERIFPKRFLAQINKDLEDRRLLLEEGDTAGKKGAVDSFPFLLLIVDNLPVGPNNNSTTEWIDSLVSEAGIASILKNGQSLNAAIIFLVPQNNKIPAECTAVYEVTVFKEDYNFRYSEIGQNTPRFIGLADHIDEKRAEKFAKEIRDKQIRRSYGADLRNSVSILELFNSNSIEELPIVQSWEHSKRFGKDKHGKSIPDWLRVPIGVRSGGDIHEVYFHQDYDGVHGMIAGTTGSGKSEMLLTLIAGLAINYDPSILNFVLVDYKGGSAFEPFRNLPHCVDIVTNLDGKAVDRMFVAIDAELKRRSGILAENNVKHIVEYREKGLHLSKEPFPHLFIVVDEFAEMINENKEYKTRFDSITRLGRAIGVDLILATQRPSGVVSDQMRANMKLRICLRVETGDDSRELLGRSDAMFLPSGIPGRAYLQVGKETPILMQVARAGGEYRAGSGTTTDQAIRIGSDNITSKTGKSFVGQWANVPFRTELYDAPNGTLRDHSKKGFNMIVLAEQNTYSDIPITNTDGKTTKQITTWAQLDEKTWVKADVLQTPTIVDLIVEETIHFAKDHSIPQTKPWPDPLPLILPLNHPIEASHLETTLKMHENQVVLHPLLRAWMSIDAGSSKALDKIKDWKAGHGVHWNHADMPDKQNIQYPLQATIGLIDAPNLAKQYILNLDLTVGPIVLFGAGGWGKTTFLKTLLISLAASHSPDELWIYALDFARGGLTDLEALPHMETSIDVSQEARIERLLRVLNNILGERGEIVREHNSFLQYNANHPQKPLPAILVVIDNFAEFKETYENYLGPLTALIRDGRNLGIYFVVTADQNSAVPSKLYSLFTQRLTLKMADAGDYQNIVGRAAHLLTEVPGRGAISIEREPREFHVGVITEIAAQSQDGRPVYEKDYEIYYRRIANRMKQEWAKDSSFITVEPLETHIQLAAPRKENKFFPSAVMGIRDIDRQSAWLELGTHCLILGAALSGRTTLLQTIVLSFSERYQPDKLVMILIDPKRSFYDLKMSNPQAEYGLGDLPHVLHTVSDTEELLSLETLLEIELNEDKQAEMLKDAADKDKIFPKPYNKDRHILFIIDNFDDIADLDRPRSPFMDVLAEIARKHRDRVHLIIAGTSDIFLRNKGNLIKRAETARYSIVLQSVELVRQLGGKVPNMSELPVGRGFSLKAGRAELFQTARYGVSKLEEPYIESLVDFIKKQQATDEKATWYFRGDNTSIELAKDKNSHDKPALLGNTEQQMEEIEIKDDVAEYMKKLLGEDKQSDSQ